MLGGAAQKVEMLGGTDSMGTEMQVPIHPKWVVSVCVSMEDMMIPILGTDRIAAISKLPANLDREAEKSEDASIVLRNRSFSSHRIWWWCPIGKRQNTSIRFVRREFRFMCIRRLAA